MMLVMVVVVMVVVMLVMVVVIIVMVIVVIMLLLLLHYSWTEKHYPYYYKKVRDVVEPASDYTVTKLGEGLYYLANVTAPARQYIHKNVPPLLEKVC
jgi:uncharacterized protein HemY